MVALNVLALLGGCMLVLYFAGSRRPEHLWAACVCLAATGAPLGFLGFSHALVGYRGDALYMMTVLPAQLAGLWFVSAYLGMPSPSKAWIVVVALAVVAVPVSMRRFDERLMWGFTQLLSLVLYLAAVRLVGKERHRSRNGRLLVVAFGLMAPFFFLETLPLLGLPDPLQGAHVSFLGWVLLAGVLLLAFMRDYGVAANDLRLQLAAAETREANMSALSEELRHQVAQRSRELRDLLVRTDGLLAPRRPALGEVFDGRYVVLRELGAGAMGAVFEVQRRTDGRRFALKVITGQVSGQSAARFAREAEIGARTRHRHLVSIVDVGIARSTTPFLVMELVHGGSLEAERARFGDDKWGRPLLAQVADALCALHAGGIIHRDLKPANVLLEAGNVKVADFGISRLDEGLGVADALGATVQASSSDQGLTGTGMMLGTPLYMAPESVTGEVGPASDVFSFGVMAYEVCTGRTPFAVPPVHLALARQPLPVPPGERVGVMATVIACLAADPAARPSAAEVADALRSLLELLGPGEGSSPGCRDGPTCQRSDRKGPSPPPHPTSPTRTAERASLSRPPRSPWARSASRNEGHGSAAQGHSEAQSVSHLAR